MVVRTFRQTWEAVWTGRRDGDGRKIHRKAGKPTKEIVYHVTSLVPEDVGGRDPCAEKPAEPVRTHWYVEVCHGRRDNGRHEDALTRRCDTNVMSAMMVARTLGMWICARNPGRTTEETVHDPMLRPSRLLRVMPKGGLQ